MIKVIFQDSSNNERLLSEVNTEEEALKVVKDFLDEHNYKSYYTRILYMKNRKILDVGSWSEFFIFEYDYDVEQEFRDNKDKNL